MTKINQQPPEVRPHEIKNQIEQQLKKTEEEYIFRFEELHKVLAIELKKLEDFEKPKGYKEDDLSTFLGYREIVEQRMIVDNLRNELAGLIKQQATKKATCLALDIEQQAQVKFRRLIVNPGEAALAAVNKSVADATK